VEEPPLLKGQELLEELSLLQGWDLVEHNKGDALAIKRQPESL